MKKINKAMFAAGCFWGIEASFKKISGVQKITVGYSGGSKVQPSYQDVCTGNTGHAEVVLVEFDSETVSFKDLLKHFWNIHDPTSLNRQGPDTGTQYRSAIFYFDEEQKRLAQDSRDEAQKNLNSPIVTEITPASKFWPAEEYHQNYLEKNNRECRI